MKTIYKYILMHDCSINMPKLSQLLSVHEQVGQICLWVLVDPQNVDETREFVVIGTGHNIPKDGHAFVGTAMMHDGSLVLHVFEKLKGE